MKPFKVNRNSWHYKLNKNFFNEYQYTMGHNWEPRHNNFCSYWRVTMIRSVFAVFLTAFICAVLYTLGSSVYYYPMEALKVVGMLIATFAGLFAILFVAFHFDRRKYKNADKPDSLFVQRYKAYKSKVCPSVEYDK